jgi:RNA polymerase sigma-70 factor (ECF subfamily)
MHPKRPSEKDGSQPRNSEPGDERTTPRFKGLNVMLFAISKENSGPQVDQGALFEGLMRKTHRQAYSLAYRLTGNSAEAEDLVQESFVRAFRFFGKYDQSMPFSSWLYRIMTNAHIDSVRRKGKLKTTSLEQGGADGGTTWEVPDLDSSPDRTMLNDALDEPVQMALSAMTPEFRMAVLLADVEGMAYEEIAEVMRTSVGTVRSRIHRGRKQIRKHLMKHAPQTYRSFSDEL